MAHEIDNQQDILDSRDIIARIEELEDEIKYSVDNTETQEAELASLQALATEAEDVSDWQHGAQLVRDSYFEDHARELAEDCGMIPQGLGWPLTCIDWERAAAELQGDYTSVDFAGVTYWVRS